jgi:hypothetical protein
MTMTVAEITTEIDSRRERIRELTLIEQQLEKSRTIAQNTVAEAVARGRSEDADAARKSLRVNTDDLAETRGALELLNREIANLESRRKMAEKREASERAQESASAARTAIGAVHDAVLEASNMILALATDANRAIGEANTYDAQNKSLNGQPVTGIEVEGWWRKPGLRDLVQTFERYVNSERYEMRLPTPAAKVA